MEDNTYKFKNCTVRIHGTPNRERIESATVKFLKKAEAQKRKRVQKNEAEKA